MGDYAIVTKIQRWSPATCDCVIEQEVTYDNTLVPGMPLHEPKFLLLNDVCEKHRPLASTEVGQKHAELSPHILDLIERTKARNLKQVNDMVAKATRRKTRRELELCRGQVIQHNNMITEEWQELITLTHAFDQHIHDQILKEQPKNNG